MSAAYFEEAATETYEEVRLLIYDTVHKFIRRYGGEFEEMAADANQYYMEAYRSFSADQGVKFSTWVRLKVWYQLLSQARNYAKKKACLNRVQEDLESVAGVEYAIFDMTEFVAELSEDARLVVQLSLLPPPGLEKIFARNGIRRARGVLREYLRGLGWTVARISESFQEVKDAL